MRYFVIGLAILVLVNSCYRRSQFGDWKQPMFSLKVSNDTAVKTTEVTVIEWLVFMHYNSYELNLLPEIDKLPTSIAAIFSEVKRSRLTPIINNKLNSHMATDHPRHALSINYKASHTYFTNDPSGLLSINTPITGISYEQATKYCNWLEQFYNTSGGRNVKVQLPPSNLINRIIENTDSINSKGCGRFNYRDCSCLVRKSKKDNYVSKMLLRIDAFWPSKNGLYNLQGNAAEMTNVKGIAMGGSYRHFAIQSHKNQYQNYDTPQEWLGFRYIIVNKNF